MTDTMENVTQREHRGFGMRRREISNITSRCNPNVLDGVGHYHRILVMVDEGRVGKTSKGTGHFCAVSLNLFNYLSHPGRLE